MRDAVTEQVANYDRPYPLWKYVLIVAVLAVACVFAAPNLYEEDPAVQISAGVTWARRRWNGSFRPCLKRDRAKSAAFGQIASWCVCGWRRAAVASNPPQ